MAVNIEQLREEVTEAVLTLMMAQFENADKNAMRDFAAIIAQAAVTAVEHIIDNAQTSISGDSII